MKRRVKLPIAASLAAVALAAMVGVAGASRGVEFSVAEQELGNLGVNATLTFTNADRQETGICPWSATLTLHRTIPKVQGILVGTFTNSIVGRCTGISFSTLRESEPWHITYESFSGTLPSIASLEIKIHRIAFQYVFFGLSCLYRGDAWGTTEGSPITSIPLARTIVIPFSEGGFGCSVSMRVDGVIRPRPTVRMRLA